MRNSRRKLIYAAFIADERMRSSASFERGLMEQSKGSNALGKGEHTQKEKETQQETYCKVGRSGLILTSGSMTFPAESVALLRFIV